MFRKAVCAAQIFLGLFGLVLSTLLIASSVTLWVFVPVVCAGVAFAGYVAAQER